MRHRRARLSILAAVAATLALTTAAPAAAARPPGAGAGRGADVIVTLRAGLNPLTVADEYRRKTGARITHVYSTALNGFAASMSELATLGLLRDRRVSRVERDLPMTVATVQTGATWGLERLDTRALALDREFDHFSSGSGVHAYVIDTGIGLTHADFTGRIGTGYDAVTAGGTAADCNGHGTHVAGTVGGTTYGVAKAVVLHPIRVLACDGSGTVSGVIAGVDWVTKNHVKPAVANMSLGGGASSSLDTAVRNSIAAGVTYSVSAGNDGKDSCNYSPARLPEALTTGATDSKDTRASWSNFGTCVDLFAPGVSITSDWYSSDTSTSTISGTSMASPHVAGVAAQYLALNPGAAPADVSAAIVGNATTGVVGSPGAGSPNRLLYSRYGEGTTTEPANTAPSASFVSQCTDLACSFTDTSIDTDGTVRAWSWSFGDGTGSTAQHPGHTYAAGGTYTVSLTVTDDDGASATVSKSVSISAPSSSAITLSASGYKVKGSKRIDLKWAGAGSTSVDVFRNGAKITTTANDGAYTDAINTKGGGSYTYELCEAGTTSCSNEATVTF